jgi:hypothetical protein
MKISFAAKEGLRKVGETRRAYNIDHIFTAVHILLG